MSKVSMNTSTVCMTLTDTNFDSEVIDCDGVVVVAFWTDWRGTCHIMAPIIEQLSVAFKGRLKVGSINFDRHAEIAQKYGVSSVPTLLFFKQGHLVDRVTGIISTKDLTEKLNTLLL